MKGFAIGCGTLVLLVAAGLAYLFFTVDFEVTAEERATCDEAVAASTRFEVDRLEPTFGIRVHNGVRSVQLVYPGDLNRPTFICTVVEGELEGVIRQEKLSPLPADEDSGQEV